MTAIGPRRIRASATDDLPRILEGSGLSRGPVLVLVGGAGGLEAHHEVAVSVLIRDCLIPVLTQAGATVVDGGTDSGIMRAIGAARSDTGAHFQLVGVAAAGTVPSPGDAETAQAEVDPNHTHIVLVPGKVWGDESPWLSQVASALSVGHRSATLLVNGGEIAYSDVQQSLAVGRPLIVLAGSGRTADAIASAASDPSVDERAQRIAASPLVQIVSLNSPSVFSAVLAEALSGATPAWQHPDLEADLQ
ncbi:hypothetical protein AB0I34_36365 [Kribbella sp. NPDC050281]|uniref:hypothetical protein n=1 Tax=Kribbella sp. NPDC050281 TaxID=3155515 RepID=UPI0033CABE9C